MILLNATLAEASYAPVAESKIMDQLNATNSEIGESCLKTLRTLFSILASKYVPLVKKEYTNIRDVTTSNASAQNSSVMFVK